MNYPATVYTMPPVQLHFRQPLRRSICVCQIKKSASFSLLHPTDVPFPLHHTSGPHSDKFNHKAYDGDRGELGGHAIPPSPRIQITQKITHPGEVNGARYIPQNPELLATKAVTGEVTGEVLVFDRMKHASEPEPDGVSRPNTRLVGQTREGYGLSWNPNKAGHILGASEDMTVCHWDCKAYSKKNSMIQPTTTFRGHTSVSLTMFPFKTGYKISQEQTPDDQEDGPPELLFVHGGHTPRPTNFCWAPEGMENWTAANMSEDNIVMVWQPTMHVWAGEQVKIDTKELED
ncbi:hypothetical protein F5878DRAFT_669700 [Lentinula raphanica]|uniref:WD40 repeat-like protein n=1 Tax=Lentinula raphanica TaxID=153919 RepID=A0AA38UHN3_9AGAR|nr:hypothetical protein F5878DRAFT_669700 [Lentinula raphanica]